MHRIDGAGHINNQFVTEDVATNRPPTEITADILNALQEELVSVILGANIALNKADNAQLSKAIAQMIGVGQVAFFATAVPPTGWIKANGSLLLISDYQRLYGVIGASFNVAGDPVTHFRVPDLRGEFLRAHDDGRGIDTGRAFGSRQDGTQLPFDSVPDSSFIGNISNASAPDAVGLDDFPEYAGGSFISTIGGGSLIAANVNIVGTARPRNVALLAAIKY
ncbi:MAG: hypothetical protein CTY21_12175 [Methylomonas sp.]|nr:MAG: hypothetical protein CTY21_12175 [Methylomonas sp.]